MSDITDAGPRLKAMNDALENRLRLTDAEREAITAAIRWCEIDAPADGDVVSRYCAARAATLRGLLERTGET